MNPPAPDDPPRDPHLLAALRHAPDRYALPPAPLTTAILDQARQAVRPARPATSGWREGLHAAFARLWQPAPMAAFGTLAMATLIGVMWGGQPLPDATPELRREQAEPAPQKARNAADAVGSAAAPTPQLRDVASSPKEAAPAVAPIGPRAPQARPAVIAQTPAKASARVTPSAPAPTAAAEAVTARAEAAPEREARRDIADASAPQAAAVAAPAAAPLQSGALAKSAADAAPAALRLRGERAGPALAASGSTVAAPLAGAAAEVDAATGSDGSRVRWRVAAQRSVAHEAAQREWWAAVQAATQGRWQGAAPGPASGPDSPAITLLIDGAPRGSLAFEPQALVWRDANGVAWRAPIGAATLRAWQEALARW